MNAADIEERDRAAANIKAIADRIKAEGRDTLTQAEGHDLAKNSATLRLISARSLTGPQPNHRFTTKSEFGGSGLATSRSELGNALTEAIQSVQSGQRSVAYVDPSTRKLTDMGEVDERQREARAWTEGGAGGGLVENQLFEPVFSLRPASIVLALPGLQVFAVTSDRARFPKIGAVDIEQIGENVDPGDSANPELDLIDIVPQKFGVLQTLSSEVIEDSTPDVLSLIGQNMLSSLGLRVDLGMLSGNGSSDLLGLRNTPGATLTSVAAALTNFDELSDALYAVRAADADPRVWVMNPRSWRDISQIKTGLAGDGTTLLEPNPQTTAETLLSLPLGLSTQVTLTEGATNVGSWIAAIDPSQFVATIRRPALLEVSKDVAFRSDAVCVKATTRVGFGCLNAPGISILTDVRSS